MTPSPHVAQAVSLLGWAGGVAAVVVIDVRYLPGANRHSQAFKEYGPDAADRLDGVPTSFSFSDRRDAVTTFHDTVRLATADGDILGGRLALVTRDGVEEREIAVG